MISAHAIGSSGGAASYHDKSFTKDGISAGADNYYANEQSSAVWKGKGAQVLGIQGQAVTKEDFVAALDGKLKNPETGLIEDLAKNSTGNRRPGFDFTVAPPKSVSIVALVGGDERVVAAHQLANERAMTWLEKHASVIRVRVDGGQPEARQAGNLLYATVQHETNRNNEPQLHNHNVIVSAVYDSEGKRWRSLTNDQLLLLRSGADMVYKAELAKQLQAIGYKLEVAPNQVDFEIAGMSRDHVEAFSQRSAEIKAALAAKGIDSENADFHQRQHATLDSRTAKTEHPREALHGIWKDVADRNGLDVDRLVTAARAADVGQQRTGMSTREQARALEVVGWAVAHLSEREQAFPRTDIELQALRFGNIAIDHVEWAMDAKIRQGQLVDRGVTDQGAQLYTTPKAIHIEQTIVAAVREGVGRGEVVMSSTVEFEAALTAFEARKSEAVGKPFKLSDEQVIAARNLLMHADMYQGVQGDAGTGKTAMLEFVKEASEAKGWTLMGMATTSAAAKTLEADSGISSQTVAGFLHDRDNSIRLARMELAELQAAIHKAVRAPEGGKSVESVKLTVR
ncbi:conjugal transfer protein, partial [Pelomonas sp. HMWF004]